MKLRSILLALIVLIVLLALNLAVFWPTERRSSPAPVPANPTMKYGYPGSAMLRYGEGCVLSYDAGNRVRDWARSRELYVYTGPLYLPEVPADGNRYVTYRVIGKDRSRYTCRKVSK